MQPSTARSRGSGGQLDDANGTRSSDHDLDRGDLEQDGGGGGWVRSLAVATFDVGTGHTLEQVTSSNYTDVFPYTLLQTERYVLHSDQIQCVDLPSCFFRVRIQMVLSFVQVSSVHAASRGGVAETASALYCFPPCRDAASV